MENKLDINGRPVVVMGQELTCTITGKKFIAARDGCSVNYAWGKDNAIVSDEGVDISEKAQLLDRTKPFYAYLSSDGKTIGGWKGNVLARVTQEGNSKSGWHGSNVCFIRAIDVHGNSWHGRGAGRGFAITLRPMKGNA